MGRRFEEFRPDVDLIIRAHIADYCSFADAVSTDATSLLGTRVSFNTRTWLAYLASRADTRLYFLVQLGRNEKKGEVRNSNR